jgi:hypothetical protein
MAVDTVWSVKAKRGTSPGLVMAAPSALLLLALTACGGTAHLRVSSDGSGVISDLSDDGHLDEHWTCGSLRAAIPKYVGHVTRAYEDPALPLYRPTAHACERGFASIRNGTTRAQVAAALGTPYFTDRYPSTVCGFSEFFSWPASTTGSTTVRICFSHSRVTGWYRSP